MQFQHNIENTSRIFLIKYLTIKYLRFFLVFFLKKVFLKFGG